ncbi:hypothetical protein D3P08_20100 [Paenibacillus nanensis]|uniref:YdeI/OmpD-associated family protein n=1 Tax=Paenibacillus nanensis TaxID=393251 RepID=A0A3A1UQ10_9BACL|nr:YdeI/OmpD-associated family protein [Paenibacillus nanensis]RIX50578.1 hypothetical protein D3P08_20100 [Paenibacillus nanensis]
MNEDLTRKLRLAPEMKAVVMNRPSDYEVLEELGLPAEAGVSAESTLAEGEYDFVLLFVTSLAELKQFAPAAIKAAAHDALLWITYPKGTSKIKTDVNRDTGWAVMIELGVEGIAMVSMNDTWSAMRYRPAGVAKTKRARKGDGNPILSIPTSKADVPLPDMPPDLKAALSGSPAAADFYGTLTDSMKRDYLSWILGAKKEETRAKRVAAAVEKLENGLKRPTDK